MQSGCMEALTFSLIEALLCLQVDEIFPLEIRLLVQHSIVSQKQEAKIAEGSLGVIVSGIIPISTPLIPGPIDPIIETAQNTDHSIRAYTTFWRTLAQL